MARGHVNPDRTNVRLDEAQMNDELIGWLRELGELSHPELVAKFDQSSHKRLIDLVQCCLEGVAIPCDLTADEFAQWIHDIRQSHLEWNRSLGLTLLEAEDASANGDNDAAVRLLTVFAERCSWIPLKDIAKGEARRHRST